MTSQFEWRMIAQDPTRKQRLLETADSYVEKLREGQEDWREYYQDVTKSVYAQQSDSG